MKEKRGFTLIELLAVIVILAIIALIATPIVLSLIDRARHGAAEDSAYGIRKEAQLLYQTTMMGRAGAFNKIEVDFSKTMEKDGKTYVETKLYETASSAGETNKVFFEADGTMPTDGKITIHGDGTVDYEILTISNYYCCIPAQGKVTCSKENNFDANCNSTGSGSSTTPSGGNTPTTTPGGDDTPTTGDDTSSTTYKHLISGTGGGATHLGIVYLNPKDLSVRCNESNSQIGNRYPTINGCMKFYIFGENGDKYKLILDHNSSHGIAYRVEAADTDRKSVFEVLATDTEDWNGNPRLITIDEVAEITGTASTGWSSTDATFSDWYCLDTGEKLESNVGCSREQGTSKYAWLTDYTYQCRNYGCNNEDAYDTAYWTSTLVKPSTNSYDTAWAVSGFGRIDGDLYVDNYSAAGVRPVIELNKNLFTTTNTPVASTTHRYSVNSSGYNPDDETTISATQPTNHLIYIKYPLTNGTVSDDQAEVCLDFGNELCLKPNEFATSTQKIKDFYGFDENTWIPAGNSWYSQDYSRKCQLETGTTVCYDEYTTSVAYDHGVANITEKNTNFMCYVVPNGHGGCNGS